MNKNTDFLKQSLIAHRGMHSIKNRIPENSIEAFAKAIEYLYIIELDVHILKDKSVIVFHDDNLKRMTGVNKKVKDYDKIRKLKLQNTNCYIPLLKDVLELVNGKVPIIIELKTDTKCGSLEEEIINILKQYKGQYAIKSFNPFSIYWLKKHNPEIVRGQLASNFKNEKMNIIKKVFLKNMILNFITKPDFISYGIDGLPNRKVEKYRKTNLVLGWTITNKFEMQKAKKYCDNMICENLVDLDNRLIK